MSEHQPTSIREMIPTVSDLKEQSFSLHEIDQLKRLWSNYSPYQDFFLGKDEWDRLRFLKWRYDNCLQGRG